MRTTKQPTAKDCFTCGYAFLRGVLTDWYFFWPYLGVPLLLGELVLCLLMVHKVPYTKIDWDAYMEEVEGPLVHDNWNYTELKGDTGPLVYPAGFVWLYGVLRWIATGGYHTLYDSSVPLRSPLDATSIRVVQYIFVGMYVTTQGLVFNLYQRAASSRVPPWACVLLCVSKRMHSLYALRLFNDCWAMFFLYLAMHLFTCQKKWYKWPLGCIMFSIGVSIKMNVILFAPALWMLMIEDIGMYGSLHCIFMCALVQVVVGAPFLTANFWGYVGRSFELGRVFTFKWSVNYKFLPEDIFVSKQLAISLLLLHVVVLSCFFTRKWYKSRGGGGGGGGGSGGGMWEVIQSSFRKTVQRDTTRTEFLVLTMFASNFIGIVFCRSLHFQFYCWYYHAVPFLLFQNERVPVLGKLMLFAGLEFTWSYCLDPVEGTSTPLSSIVLQITHALMLISLWYSKPVERGVVVVVKEESVKSMGSNKKKEQ